MNDVFLKKNGRTGKRHTAASARGHTHTPANLEVATVQSIYGKANIKLFNARSVCSEKQLGNLINPNKAC